jgi:hypothetical protein
VQPASPPVQLLRGLYTLLQDRRLPAPAMTTKLVKRDVTCGSVSAVTAGEGLSVHTSNSSSCFSKHASRSIVATTLQLDCL